MIESGSSRKYLLYAIGETLLVVIGILIALQINNWNEGRKLARTEAYTLSEILSNLEEDSEQMKIITDRRQQGKNAVENLVTTLSEGNTLASDQAEHVSTFLSFERFYPLSNAYTMMKSTGSKIKNRFLRSEISRYYDFELEKIKDSVSDIEGVIIRIYNTENAIRSNIKYSRSGAGLETDIRFHNINDPLFRKSLLTELTNFGDNNSATLQKAEKFLEQNHTLIQLVKDELNTARLKKYLLQTE